MTGKATNNLPIVDSLDVEATDRAMMASFDGSRIDLREYRKLETLPQRAWEYLDDVLIRTAKEELVGVADLNSRPNLNVTFDGMSASVYYKERISEVGDANMAMTPDVSAESAIVAMDKIGVPMFFTYKDYFLNSKRTAMAARVGLPIDTSLAEEAARSVSRLLEQTLFNGAYHSAGADLWGYTTFPSRNQYTLTASWALTATTPDQILGDVNNMMELSMAQNHYGPWILYIPWQYRGRLNLDYTIGAVSSTVSPSLSVEGRLLQLPGLDAIRTTPYLATDNVVLVEMSSSTVQNINGLPMRTVLWEPPGTPNLEHRYKVMTISVPFLVSDYKGQCGIVHGHL